MRPLRGVFNVVKGIDDVVHLLLATAFVLAMVIGVPLHIVREWLPGRTVLAAVLLAAHSGMVAVAVVDAWRRRWSPVSRLLVAVWVGFALLTLLA